MKICIVSCEYPPFQGGGIGTYSAIMSRCLAAAGHEVHVIANRWDDFETGSDWDLPRFENLYIHRVDALSRQYRPRSRFSSPGARLAAVCRDWELSLFWSTCVADELERVHREHKFDVVEFPECFAEGYVSLRRRRTGNGALDVPMSVTLHSPMFEVGKHNQVVRSAAWFRRRSAMEDYCIKNADSIASPSSHLLEQVSHRLNLDLSTRPCHVIHNPLDALPPLDPANLSVAPLESPWLLFVGRLEPRKGVKMLVDAAIGVMDEVPGLRLMLVGRDCDAAEAPGSMRDYLLERIPPSLIERFVFRGQLPREEVRQLYRQATACVFSPPWDNFPYACCEAMAAGACVIASRDSGMAEMIQHEQSGLLVSGGDVAALRDAILRVFADADLRQRLQEAAAPRIHSLCDPQIAVEKRLDLYQKTVEQHRARPRGSLKPLQQVGKRQSKVAVYVSSGSLPSTATAATVDSLLHAAASAEVQLEITVSGNPGLLSPLADRLHKISPHDRGDSADLRDWIECQQRRCPAYLLAMHAGEQVGRDFFNATLRCFHRIPQAAWATTWACSTQSFGPVYAGLDFDVPLELTHYHPVPFALIREQAFCEVGGWNLDLPQGWREWDLWLAFQQAGFEGVVAPVWQAKFRSDVNRDLRPPAHQRTHERILEQILQRNGSLLSGHTADLWMTSAVNGAASDSSRTTNGPGYRWTVSRRRMAAARRHLRGFLHRARKWSPWQTSGANERQPADA